MGEENKIFYLSEEEAKAKTEELKSDKDRLVIEIDGRECRNLSSYFRLISEAFRFPKLAETMEEYRESIKDLRWIKQKNIAVMINHLPDFLSENMKEKSELIRDLEFKIIYWWEFNSVDEPSIGYSREFHIYLIGLQNRFIRLSEGEMKEKLIELKEDKSRFVAEMDGREYPYLRNYFDRISELLDFPLKYNLGFDSYYDWIADLTWPSMDVYKKVAIVIYHFSDFIKEELLNKAELMEQFQENVFPWWEFMIGNEKETKEFMVYLVD